MEHTSLEAVYIYTSIFNKVNKGLSVIKNYTVSLWINKEIDLPKKSKPISCCI